MTATKLLAAIGLLAAAGTVFAADTANTEARAAKPADKAELVLARANTTPAHPAGVRPAAANEQAGRSRAEVRAEAVEALKQHRSTLAESFDLSKN